MASTARYAVAVRQIERGNSEDHANWVAVRVNSLVSELFRVIPGGDGWDNPPICCVLLTSKRAAERVAQHFGGELIDLDEL